jgi:hypothetical protein
MREERVDLDARNGLFRGGPLFYDSDTVDNDAWLFLREKILQRRRVRGIHPFDHAAVLEEIDMAERRRSDGSADGAGGVRVRGTEALEKFMAQHAGAAEDQDFHERE